MSRSVRTWYVRGWVRAAALSAGVLSAVLAVGVGVDGVSSHMRQDFVVGAFLTVGAFAFPYLGWRPLIRLHGDGVVELRGWLSSRCTTTADIHDMYMTELRLRFEMSDATRFTSVVFQATMYLRYPRYVEVVHAITGSWPEGVPHP